MLKVVISKEENDKSRGHIQRCPWQWVASLSPRTVPKLASWQRLRLRFKDAAAEHTQAQRKDQDATALVLVFQRLPLYERLCLVPTICKRWRKVAMEPKVWEDVNMVPWIQERTDDIYAWEETCGPVVDRLVRTVVDLSRGQLRELRTMHVSDDTTDYLAVKCSKLEVLEITYSPNVTNDSAIKLAKSSPRLRQLDVSDCYNLSTETLKAFGDNCPSLEWIGRNMLKQNAVYHRADEDAIVIADHCLKVKHLELKRSSISDKGLLYLADKCRNLESLNLAACYQLSQGVLTEVGSKYSNIRKLTKPIKPRLFRSIHPQHVMMFD